MLGMKEKLELTSQLNNVTRQLKSGELGMMERLQLSGERNSILAKLKAKPKPVEPPADTVETPEPELEPEQVESGKPKTHRYNSNIGSKVKAGDEILNAKMDTWTKKYKAENALNAADLQGLAIPVGSDEFGWRIKVIDQLPEGTVLEVFENQKTVSGLDTWVYSVKVKDGNGEVDTKLLQVAKAFESGAHVVGDAVEMSVFNIEQMARDKGFKLDLSNLSADGRAGFDSELEDKPEQIESELIAKFKAGDFNNTKPAEFVEIMRDVHTDGLPLDDVKQGAISWFGANPNLIADKAA